MATGCPPSYEEIALADSVAAWTAAVEGLAGWWAGALARGATAPELWMDCLRWLDVMSARRRPAWATAHEIVFEAPVARLRDFSLPGSGQELVPTLVLPPQAGHDSCIVDYSPAQSQMRTILEAGLTRAFALDWIGATEQTKNAGIDDYLAVIDRALERIGSPVNLVGDCQGGWLATIYAALHPERVNTLTIGGAPIDFHAGEPVIGAALRSLAPGGDLGFYRALVRAGGGRLDGRHLLAGFIAINPDNEVGRQLTLLANISDPEHVARYREFEDWFKHTQAVPGPFYLWIVEHLFRDNKLVTGTLALRGARVDLGRIRCPLNLLAGASDHITPPAQVFALAQHARTPRRQIVRDTCASGHLGLFMGRESLREHWPKLLAAVLAHSR
ncbi:MAG: alpha/beta fold hydrolase [Solirubrobacteraceae bacterium]